MHAGTRTQGAGKPNPVRPAAPPPTSAAAVSAPPQQVAVRRATTRAQPARAAPPAPGRTTAPPAPSPPPPGHRSIERRLQATCEALASHRLHRIEETAAQEGTQQTRAPEGRCASHVKGLVASRSLRPAFRPSLFACPVHPNPSGIAGTLRLSSVKPQHHPRYTTTTTTTITTTATSPAPLPAPHVATVCARLLQRRPPVLRNELRHSDGGRHPRQGQPALPPGPRPPSLTAPAPRSPPP